MNALGLYTGFSSNHWHRDIQATKSTRQLTEIYSWLDASLGAYYAFNLNDSGKLIVEADLNRSISPQVEIVLTALGVGSPNLELEEKLGFRLATRYCYAMTSQLKWEAGFSYRYYQFGKSDTLQLSSGNRLFSIHEPESHSALLSLQTGVRWVF